MLHNTLGDKWTTLEGKLASSKILPEQISDFIKNNPGVCAISSHHAQLPLPDISDSIIFPIVFLRHPLDRVRSIYDFERKQGLKLGPVSRGAEYAAKLSFADYLHWRFASSRNGVAHNGQTLWLLHEKKYQKYDILEKDFHQACIQLNSLNFFGLVENFQSSISLLANSLMQHGVMLDTNYQAINTNSDRHESLDQRLEALRGNVGEEMWVELQERNLWDLRLYEMATEEFNHRATNQCFNFVMSQKKANK